MRFFHGSFAALHPGDILVPGTQIGVSVHQISDHVYAAAGDSYDSMIEAIELAFEFGCYSADLFCPVHAGEEGEPVFEHADRLTLQILQDCVRIYEVEPVGEVELDPAEDFAAGTSVRLSAATVLARVDADGEWY